MDGNPADGGIPDARTVTGLPLKFEVLTPEQKAADRALRWKTLGRIGSVFLMVMFFWAIFDQSASTWIFFADTYMDTTLFGRPTSPPDAIQAFNPVFIVALVPVSVALFKVFPLRATTKMMIGFVLTGLSMVIMSLSGFLAGEAQKAVKVTSRRGRLVLPHVDTPLDRSSRQAASRWPSGTDVKVSATDWVQRGQQEADVHERQADPGRSAGKCRSTGGHLSPRTPDAASPAAGGVLEPLLKSGERPGTGEAGRDQGDDGGDRLG